MKREILLFQSVVWASDLKGGVRISFFCAVYPEQTWTYLILNSVICSCLEMTCRAGGHPIASDLHVPEEGFSESNRGYLILDEFADLRWFWDFD